MEFQDLFNLAVECAKVLQKPVKAEASPEKTDGIVPALQALLMPHMAFLAQGIAMGNLVPSGTGAREKELLRLWRSVSSARADFASAKFDEMGIWVESAPDGLDWVEEPSPFQRILTVVGAALDGPEFDAAAISTRAENLKGATEGEKKAIAVFAAIKAAFTAMVNPKARLSNTVEIPPNFAAGETQSRKVTILWDVLGLDDPFPITNAGRPPSK
jgi:hypothetical protein